MAISKENFSKYAKIALVFAGALIIAPVIYTAIGGLIGAGIAFVVGSLFIALRGPVGDIMTTIKFKATKAVIDHAPVEALQRSAEERHQALAEQSKLLHAQATGLEMLKKRAQKIAKDFPEEAQEMETMLQQREKVFAFKVNRFKLAKKDTDLFMRTVDKAEAMYQIAVADNELDLKSAGENDFMKKFKEKYAFEAIDKANAQSMASLRMAMTEVEEIPADVVVPAVTYTQDNTVDLGSILNVETLKQPVAR